MPCRKNYTVTEVKSILDYSEHGTKSAPKSESRSVPTLHGSLSIALNSDDKTGHAQSRHLVITDGGLKDRTLGVGGEGGLPQASAFVADKLNNLIFVVTQLLNSDKGQEGLAALDAYENQGKTRIVIVEEAATLRCTHIPTRVFYQGDKSVTQEKLSRAAIVVDSNLGGKYPIKIVTAFPCKEDPGLEIGLSALMIQARDASKASGNPFLKPVTDLMPKLKAWTAKSYKKIPQDLLYSNNIFLLGAKFNSAWINVNPAIYKYKYPLVLDKDADVRLDGRPSYEMVPAGVPKESKLSIPVLQQQAEAASLRLLEVEQGRKLGIFLVA